MRPVGRLLLQGGVVVSLDRQVGNHARADVLVEDGRITEVGPDLRGRGAEVVDATDGLVMPGLVDGHRHAWRSLGRNAVPGSQPPAPRDHTPDDVHAATLLTLAGAAEIGTTTLAHWLDGALAADAILAAGRAHREAGLRGVLVVEHRADVDLGEMVRDLALPDDTHGPGAPLLVVAIGVTDPERYDDAALAAIWRSAQAEDLRVHVRLGTTAAARGQVARLDRLGLLDQPASC
jgi:cytosine/adenosine deaminase-related metal-dependent hydrolase